MQIGSIIGWGTRVQSENIYITSNQWEDKYVEEWPDYGGSAIVSEAELKEIPSGLKNAFTKDVNGKNKGFPILKWQIK